MRRGERLVRCGDSCYFKSLAIIGKTFIVLMPLRKVFRAPFIKRIRIAIAITPIFLRPFEAGIMTAIVVIGVLGFGAFLLVA